MSLFLAPVHTWLFNKIVVLEDIEKAIEAQFDDQDTQAFSTDLKESMGDYIPNLPLETLIDTGNIHGWLQSKITLAESRQAALVSYLLSKSEVYEEIQAIYHNYGMKAAATLTDQPTEAIQLFNALNDFLLEGMPCDHVNSVQTNTSDEIIWKTTQCVHQNNWEKSGVDVNVYYGFRAAFISGFVKAANEEFIYAYSNEEEQIHKIYKNV